MSDPGDGGDPPHRALLVAGAAMAGVALLVGLAIAVAVITAVRMTGLDSAGSSSAASHPSLYMPRYHRTRAAVDEPNLPSPSPSATKEHRASKPKAQPKTGVIKLFEAPQKVAPGGRINLNGVYADGEGVVLQVQRQDPGGWTDFPVKATVRGG
ncbi:MAG: hypothetical protein QOK15_25, partial [Nocardioidaceae bacterium]|nr:hypothetical protein [Nocardioidaceae bacterium]